MRPTATAAIVALLVFAPVVTFGFVYDDHWTLVDNRWLDHSSDELLRLLATGAAVGKVPDATRPAMVLGHWLERRAFGLSAWAYHLDSLLLYGLATALATSVAFCVARRRGVALFAGCFFAVAPIHAEPVAAVNYREDLLAAVGVLGTLLCLCAPRRDSASIGDDKGWRPLGAAALLALGLFGKESAIAVVPLLGLLMWLLPGLRERVLRRPRTCCALGLAVGVWLLWRVPLAVHGDDVPLAPSRPLLQTLLRTARFEVQAVRYALLPFSYSPDHWRQPDAGFGWLGPFVSLVLGVALFGRQSRFRVPAVGVGVALAAPLACCPLLRPVNEFADRYFFLGVLGGGLVWGWVALRLAQAWAHERQQRWLLLVLVPLVPLTLRATALWKSERTLWTAAVELSPGSPRAWASLSRVHRRAGEREAADMTIARALAANSDYGPALVTQIYNELAFGRLAEARAHLEELERRGRQREAGLAKAARCAKLDAVEAARCIGP